MSIKTEQEIQIMREGGKILAQILDQLAKAVAPGVTTESLDKLARELILFNKVKPSFLGYGGFPAVLCTSVNDEIVHGVPSDRVLKEGDILGLDFGVVHGGFHTDSAITVPVLGSNSLKKWTKENPRTAQMIEVARSALAMGISKARAGRNLGEVSHAIQEHIEKAGFGVVRDLVGHGIGKKLHEEPYVANYGDPGDGPVLQEGMTIAIEPMVTMGDWRVKQQGQVFKTRDGSLSSHFEHTILITKRSAEILTTR